ncbi:sugar transferase [Patescibacteria group bacterium AH-259-L05]|nr:sugar transferase [Patescibacteria group bacterium AH-259-L05]
MIKRLFDTFCSLIGLFILAPFLLIISIAIKLDSPGHVFHRGLRIGKNEKPFRIYKFRTMIKDAEKLGPTSTAEDDPRITKIGRFIRKYKLDELPQLINVLKGEMSFVGPRPQVPWAVKLYTQEEKALLSVRPGITDYASIAFPNEEEILRGSKDPDKDYMEKINPEKVRLGLQYVKNHSLWIDIKIILKTIKILFKR